MTKNQVMTYGAIAFAGYAVWFAMKQKGALPMTGEQQRMQGTADWLGQNAAQNNAVNQAIGQQWQSMAQTFKTQPDFYI